jgi:hypothetical protein
MAGVGARVMSGVPLVGLGSGVDAQSAFNIIYIMRNAASVGRWLCRLRLAMAGPLARLLPACSFPRQGRARSMIKIDPRDRIDLTGPWVGFGF